MIPNDVLTELKFIRLKCGCLITCKDGGILIEHPICAEYNCVNCGVGDYLKEHTRCPVCGECELCYLHAKCGGSLKKGVHRVIRWFTLLISQVAYTMKVKLQRGSNHARTKEN